MEENISKMSDIKIKSAWFLSTHILKFKKNVRREVNVRGPNEVTEELMESGKGGKQVADGKKRGA